MARAVRRCIRNGHLRAVFADRRRTDTVEHGLLQGTRPPMTGTQLLSVAIPLNNEELSVPELLSRLGAVLDAIPGGPHEIVLVDNGSTDRTLELLDAAAQVDPRLVIVALSRNFGHQAALSA